jgi:tetratricopeptide (TPR) repeat protein
MELREMPRDDPAVAFGRMPDNRMVLTKGVNVRFESATLGKQVVLQKMRPGGVDAYPSGFESSGFNRDMVHGGFHVFGDQPADDDMVHALVHQRLAGSFFEEGLYDVVEEGCRKSLDMYSGEVLSWVNMGKVYMHKGEYYKAESAFKRAQKSVTVSRREKAEAMVWTHNYLGNCYDLLGHREMAKAEYQKVVEMDNNYRGAVDYAQKYLKKPFDKENP